MDTHKSNPDLLLERFVLKYISYLVVILILLVLIADISEIMLG